MELIPGVAEGLRRLRKLGLGLVVVTNQSGVGRGLFDRPRLDLIHQRMSELLQQRGSSSTESILVPTRPRMTANAGNPGRGCWSWRAES